MTKMSENPTAICCARKNEKKEKENSLCTQSELERLRKYLGKINENDQRGNGK